MELIYAGMLLHKSGRPINESNIKKVLEAAGSKVDDTKVKALVAALEGVNIEKVIEESKVSVAAPVAEAKVDKKEEKKKEEKKSETEAAVGLGALFG